MAQNDRNDTDMPNRSSNMEPAEGSRETVRGSDRGGGITNRGLDRERSEQQELPERGKSKDESQGMSQESGSPSGTER